MYPVVGQNREVPKISVTLENPEVIAEIEWLMARFDLSAEAVLESVIVEAGAWMPMEILADRVRSLATGELGKK